MKTHAVIWMAALSAGVLWVAPKARAELSISAGIHIGSVAEFHDPLASLGAWVNVGSYGSCWHPRVAADWRPYCDGSWVWTDAGWYWQSDDAWAWACYHYGSWVDDPNVGWVWMPGTEWAPAWVSWRYSDDYIGWAPCGPHEAVLPGQFFTFVDVHHFHDRIRRDSVIVNNTEIINRTTVVNNFSRESRTINGAKETIATDRGLGVDRIQRVTGRKFEAKPLDQVVGSARRPETARSSSEPTRGQTAQPQAQRRVIQEPSGAQTPAEQRQAPTRKAQENVIRTPAAPAPAPEARRVQSPNAQRGTAGTLQTQPSAAARENPRTITEASGAQQQNRRVTQQPSAPRQTPQTVRPPPSAPRTIQEPSGAQRETPRRPAVSAPVERRPSVEAKPAPRPRESAPRPEAAPPKSEKPTPPPEDKKEPRS